MRLEVYRIVPLASLTIDDLSHLGVLSGIHRAAIRTRHGIGKNIQHNDLLLGHRMADL